MQIKWKLKVVKLNILVTGGAGYIGSHTVRRLQQEGQNTVTVFDNLSTGHRKAAGETNFILGDLTDQALLTEVLNKEKIDCVMHFAAKSLVGESLVRPRDYYINNVLGTLSLLNSMLACNIRKLVFSSTAAIYGEPSKIPVTEEEPKNPTSVYGRTKLVIENILHDYSRAYDFSFISLRYFNAAGADESGDLGEDHEPETHLIPLVMQHILGIRDRVQLYGIDYPTKDGTCIRDFVHVNDLADAHLLSLGVLAQQGKSNVYNLGNGNGFSVKEVINSIQKITGKKVNVEIAPKRSGDPAALIASSEKIKNELGWFPRYTSLDDIVRTAWNWHKRNPGGYRDDFKSGK